MVLSSGAKKHRITIEAKKRTPNKSGGFTEIWVSRYATWAAIWPVKADEKTASDKPVMVVTHRIRMSFIPNFDPAWRVKFGKRYFSIISVVSPEESGLEIDLLCKETLA